MYRLLLLCVCWVLCIGAHAQAQQITPNPDYATFTLLKESAFPGRDAHTAIIVDKTLLIAGGEDANRTALNDVWISTPPDSGVFTQVNVTNKFSARADHSTVLFGTNKIIIMAGQFNSSILYNDVWSSTDMGVTWTQIQANAPWAPRIGAMAVVQNGTIIMVGGYLSTSTPKIHCSEVWSSPDGITWTLVSNNTFPGRADARVDLVGNALVMTGGENGPPANVYSDVYRSVDGGVSWSVVNGNAPFGRRFQHTSDVVGDQIVLTTGLRNFSYAFNDVWASHDQGTTWTLITQQAAYAPRAHAETAVYKSTNGPVFILTGGNKGGFSQVWIARGLPLVITTPSPPTNPPKGSATACSVGLVTIAATIGAAIIQHILP